MLRQNIAPILKKIIRYIRNGLKFFLTNSSFNFLQKIKTIRLNSCRRDTIIHNLLLKKLRGGKSEEKYFLIEGYKIYYRPDYEISDEDYFLRGVTQVLAETFLFPIFFNSKVKIKKGDIVFDLGGSIGTTCLLFSKYCGENGKVFTFEPVTHSVIYKNLESNFIKNITVIPMGVADEVKKVEIEFSAFFTDSSICKRKYTKGYYKSSKVIEAITLDKFCEKTDLKRIDFIKMDIEGAEELAIKGAERVINKYHPKWSISSYHIDFNNEPQHDKLVKLLKGFGYRVEEERDFHIYAW